jgi:two-component sensor histidine kinase
MVLHELTTNAAKHGALSTDDGLVSVRWRRASSADACLCIEWRETGGPAAHVPRRSSYGTEVIRNLIPYELGGTVDLAFAPEGVRCVVNIPATELSPGKLGGKLRLVDLGQRERELSHG